MSRYLRCRTHRALPLRLTALEDRAVPASFTWDGGPAGAGTDFTAGVNWVGDVAPGSADDASIGVTFNTATITVNGGYTLNSLSCQSSLVVTNGTFNLAKSS